MSKVHALDCHAVAQLDPCKAIRRLRDANGSPIDTVWHSSGDSSMRQSASAQLYTSGCNRRARAAQQAGAHAPSLDKWSLMVCTYVQPSLMFPKFRNRDTCTMVVAVGTRDNGHVAMECRIAAREDGRGGGQRAGRVTKVRPNQSTTATQKRGCLPHNGRVSPLSHVAPLPTPAAR